MAHLRDQNLIEAGDHLRACLRIYQRLGYKSAAIISFEGLAAVAAAQQQPVDALWLLAVATELRRNTGQPHTAFEEELYHRPVIELAKQALDEEAWQAIWAEGASLSLDDAFARALRPGP
jgi:hypothetical protein